VPRNPLSAAAEDTAPLEPLAEPVQHYHFVPESALGDDSGDLGYVQIDIGEIVGDIWTDEAQTVKMLSS
jgi:hypothetical protein